MKSERKGNLELLRILCMILIIIHHYCLHGGIQDAETMIGNQFVSNIGLIIGRLASNGFVIITGYFLFQYKFKVQKIIKLILETIFYAILTNIVMIVLLGDEFQKYLAYSIFPISFKVNWFITAYLSIYILIPLIRPTLNKLTKQNYLILLLILGIAITIIPTCLGMIYNTDVEPFGEIVSVLYVALIGGYISKFDVCIFKNKIGDIIFILGGLLVASERIYLRNNQFGSIIIAVLLLDLFKKMQIKNNKLITFFSSSCLGVLLLHDNEFFNEAVWKKILKTEAYYTAPTLNLILHIFVCTIAILLIGSIIDYIRRKIEEKTIGKILDRSKTLEKVNEIFNN